MNAAHVLSRRCMRARCAHWNPRAQENNLQLPLGPVITSPDRLFTSMKREVYLRQPHTFKIAALSSIRDLFPSSVSPFYAGFGNRDTDTVSYRAVGIPDGKIFIIYARGEISQENLMLRQSYPSLSVLADNVFPATVEVRIAGTPVGAKYGAPRALIDQYSDVSARSACWACGTGSNAICRCAGSFLACSAPRDPRLGRRRARQGRQEGSQEEGCQKVVDGGVSCANELQDVVCLCVCVCR